LVEILKAVGLGLGADKNAIVPYSVPASRHGSAEKLGVSPT
jgi:hypothetical protein